MLALGFSSGLPAVLVFGTLSIWLRSRSISLETIAFFSLVSLVYSVKFIWAPLVDRVRLPLITARLGLRRSWMLGSQVLVALGLCILAGIDAPARLPLTAALAVLIGFASATQDIAIDAWRIEAGGESRSGMLAASYQWGYRIAMLVAGAVPLMVAEPFGWNVSYAAMTALTGIGIAAVLLAPSEDLIVPTPPRAREDSTSHVTYAFVDPVRDFFHRHGRGAALALVLVCTYRLPDLVRSIGGPFYLDVGFTLAEIARVQRVWGIFMTMVGVGAGGIAVARFGLRQALVMGAACGPIAGLALAWMAIEGRNLIALVVTTSIEQAAGGFAGTCLIAYMSSLTSRGFTATQYALLSSLFTLPGRLLGSQSGRIVEAAANAAAGGTAFTPVMSLFSMLPAGSYPAVAMPSAQGAGYAVFFLYSAALGLPTILLALLARR
jgi:PAT family beta-lactamase induction signal transducer AmpG